MTKDSNYNISTSIGGIILRPVFVYRTPNILNAKANSCSFLLHILTVTLDDTEHVINICNVKTGRS